MKIDPNAPAFPSPMINLNIEGSFIRNQAGLSIRAEIASTIMAGLLANPSGPLQANGMTGWNFVNCDPVDVSRLSISLADDLISELNKPEP